MRVEIGLEKAVDGIGILRAGGDFRVARLEVVRFGTGKGDVGVPFGALINPGAEEANLFGSELGTFLGHLGIGVETLDKFDEEAVGALSDNDSRAGVAAFEEGVAGVDFEAAFVASPAVAIEATGFEDGFDFFGEINGVIGRRRQLGSLFGREIGVKRGATAEPNRQRQFR